MKLSKIFKAVAAGALVFSLAACGSGTESASTDNADSTDAPDNADDAATDEGEAAGDSNFPEKPITLVVSWDAGGGTDIQARAFAQSGQEYLGVPLNVVNKPGGSGAVGWGEIAHSTEPDGYTLSVVTPEIGYQRDAGLYDFGLEDFTLITMFNEDPAALTVRADAPWDTLDEFLADAANENLSVGTAGPGIIWDFAATAIEDVADITLNHVPFDGSAGSVQALLGKQIDSMSFSLGEVSAQVEAGELKVLAIAAGERNENFPDVPTFSELGYDVTVGTIRGVAGPAGMDEATVEFLNEAFLQMAEDPAFTEIMNNNNFGINVKGTEDFVEYFGNSVETFREIIQASADTK